MNYVDKHKHNVTMQRKKLMVDDQIAHAQQERGVLILITGDGKGKTTSAFGTAFRALGHGMRVGIIQFIKGTQATGEVIYLAQQHPQLSYHAMSTGFTWDTQDWEKDKSAAEETWIQAKRMLSDPEIQLVVLDELTYMFTYEYLDITDVIQAIHQRAARQNVIITGRGAKPELIAVADTVSEIAAVKHAFQDGVKAQAGVDF
ncbi:MAG: cob(I)yrinic acid a,c-diamide adenosyltransferase [Gammaproteobacteria bacterium]|nr:cob(I)yrinic acid a,c-diamide adenosyltransferase [Gammaproteobacteria bacterium]MCY4217881.1 cob(I)yrinic acid a,c-diamide adenosyltransferase [Gammaproteobacteria bacterium]MCY4274170.1 cob(I)yrinic acid a,c-diamide adenosyltransferase [Gammaproteobacteria bacterium]